MIEVGDKVIVAPADGQNVNLVAIETSSISVGDKVVLMPANGENANLVAKRPGEIHIDDTVFVTSLHGQNDNRVAVLARKYEFEGNFNTWTMKWIKDPADCMGSDWCGVHIDEKSETLSVAYADDYSGGSRFGVYSLSNFTPLFESSKYDDYLTQAPGLASRYNFYLGLVEFCHGGISQSIQSYTLLKRWTGTIEVWRGGATPLWSRDTNLDSGGPYGCSTATISTTGKYILAVVDTGHYQLMLYEGSYVEE